MMERIRFGIWVFAGAAAGLAFGNVGVGVAVGLILAIANGKPDAK